MKNDTGKLAQQLHSRGQFDQAINEYEKLLENTENTSEKADIHRLIAIAKSQLDKHEAAIEHIDISLSLDEQSPAAWHTKGMIKLKMNDIASSKSHFKKSLKINKQYIPSLQSLGNMAYHNEDLTKAKHYYQQITDADPKHAHAHFNLALVDIKKNDLQSAITHLDKVLDINPNHSKALGQKGEILMELKQFKQAALCFTVKLTIEPYHAETWHSLGQAEMKLGNMKAAIESFKNCLNDNNKHPMANQDLANAYVKTADYPSALSRYFKQLETHPNAESFYNVGVLLMYREHNKDALTYLLHALRLDPENVDGHINVANILLKQGKHKEASRHYQMALDIKPHNAEIEHILAAINHSSTPVKAPKEYLQHLFDQYAPYYDKHLTEQLRYNTPEKMLNTIEHNYNIDREWTVLDLGCGTGLCGEKFKHMANKLIGVDIAEKMLAVAKQKNIYDELIIADIHSALDQFNDIDLIIAADVFTYTGDLLPLISSCHQALKPNGILIFTVEKTSNTGYILQPSIRYAHHRDHITAALNQSEWSDYSIEPMELREQNKKTVKGYCVMAHKR